MFYESSKSVVTKEGIWDEKSCVRRVGGYDIDVTKLPEGMTALPKGAVMEYNPATGKVSPITAGAATEGFIVLGLNYATVKIKGNPSCTVTLQAYEIEEDSLPYAINDTIKEALTCRHAFKV